MMEETRIKISGYLEKKGKMRMMSSWKKYWFVLEGRLLLYYRSKNEYDALSPCKGSINLGPPCSVKSCPAICCGFQIETRTNTITLRAENADEQKKWMQTIMSALNQNFNVFPNAKLSHFRYSFDNLAPKEKLERQNTMPNRGKNSEKNQEIINKLQKIGAQTYGGSLNAINKIVRKSADQNLLEISQNNPKKSQSSLESLQTRPENYGNIYESITETIRNQEKRIESFIVDNENYSIPIKKTLCDNFLVENDQYSKAEAIYSEPKTDHNKNSVLVEENAYANCINTENEYEELEKYSHRCEQVEKILENSPKNKRKTIRKLISDRMFVKDDRNKSIKKSRSFLKRVWKRTKKREKTEEIYEEVDRKVVEKLERNNGNTVQILSELHDTFDHKKEYNVSLQKSLSTPEPDFECPSLPPKNRHSSLKLKSIDEILEELNREEQTSVVLRKNSNENDNRHPKDLSRLLDELAKVTIAPVMTPGVTTSLVNPHLTDEELLKLLPIRKRRLSEPDYDIPRSHKSLQANKEEKLEIFPATRFFGPVLQANENNDALLQNSITPDSLEVEKPEDRNNSSYNSHNYVQDKSEHSTMVLKGLKYCSHNYQRNTDDEVVYAQPKALINTCNSFCDRNNGNKNFKGEMEEEIFKDSLEVCTASTAF